MGAYFGNLCWSESEAENLIAMTSAPKNEVQSSDSQNAAPETKEFEGPHLWLNWQAKIIGQPARSESHGNSILIHPLWEERALYSDAEIAGEIEFGPYALLMTLSGGQGVGRAFQTLVFRHRDHLFEAPPEIKKELDVGGWTGGDLGDQAAALLSLALGRRVRSGGVVRQGFEPGDPLGRPLAADHLQPTLVEPRRAPMLPVITERTLVQPVGPLVERYGRLRGADALALTRAAGQYADALWWADADPRISWIKLVGALEAAANRWEEERNQDPVALLKRHRGDIYGPLKRIDERAVKVVASKLSRTLNAEDKLLAFSLHYAPGPPEIRPKEAQVDFDNLGPALRLIYEWRSRDLHDGIPFPPPLCEPPDPNPNGPSYERFPMLGVEMGGGYWPAEVLPMYLHLFAYIVGGALRNWWEDLPTPGPPDLSNEAEPPSPSTHDSSK